MIIELANMAEKDDEKYDVLEKIGEYLLHFISAERDTSAGHVQRLDSEDD